MENLNPKSPVLITETHSHLINSAEPFEDIQLSKSPAPDRSLGFVNKCSDFY